MLKVFPDGLMDDMASKNISSCTVSYKALPIKTDLHYQPTLSWLQNFQQTSVQLFFVSPQIAQNAVALTHFFQHVPHIENTFKYINTYAYSFCWSV